jgi:hypothetical protein
MANHEDGAQRQRAVAGTRKACGDPWRYREADIGPINVFFPLNGEVNSPLIQMGSQISAANSFLRILSHENRKNKVVY